jgi:uncharacterized protein (UPF0548 family)
MFRLTSPSEGEVRSFVSDQEQSRFSYAEIGASAGKIPAGYNIDHNRIRLGKGEDCWQRAEDAMHRWEMFNMPWLRLYWPTAPIRIGTNVAVSVYHLGFYSLNACRIVYLVDEDGPVKRFGFAYGTLLEHAESGEERFMIEWDGRDDSVCYDILAFSRPRKLPARLGYPISRALQRRFAEGSKRAMLDYVGCL